MDNWIPNYFDNPTRDIDSCYLASYSLNTNANHKWLNDAQEQMEETHCVY